MLNDQVDLVLTATPEQMPAAFTPNPPRKRGPVLVLPEPYAEAAKFVVRTALIRVPGFDRAKKVKVLGPSSAALVCRHVVHYDQEHLITIALDTASHVVAIHEVGVGTRSSTMMAISDMIKIPLLCGSSAVIIAHNHPSGRPDPSDTDIETFESAKRALSCAGIQLIDSLVIARGGYWSIDTKSYEPWPNWVTSEWMDIDLAQ
jgi:DNA repair protein RadC